MKNGVYIVKLENDEGIDYVGTSKTKKINCRQIYEPLFSATTKD